MRKVKILTDSCADLSAELLERYDIAYAKMSTFLDGRKSPALLRTPLPATAIMAAMVLLLAVRHRENFRRLREGTENRFHLKKTG